MGVLCSSASARVLSTSETVRHESMRRDTPAMQQHMRDHTDRDVTMQAKLTMPLS
jgi:hypothetical protein